MSNWRRKVLALFPDLCAGRRRDFSVYAIFFELLPRVRQAHQDRNDDLLQRIYGFAAWCFDQPAEKLWNPAGVAFYEHLFDDHHTPWPDIVRWLSPRVVTGCWPLWEQRLDTAKLSEVQRLITQCRPRYHEANLFHYRC